MRVSSLRHVFGYALVIALAIAGTAQALPGRNTVTSDDIVNGQVKKVDLARGSVNSAKVADGTLTGADIANHSIKPADLAKKYYTKAEINAILSNYVSHSELGSVAGTLRWGFIRDFDPSPAEVYVDNFSTIAPSMTVTRTATGVFDVVIPGITADGGFHGIWVTAEPGITSERTCVVFQTTYGPTADSVKVTVRCYDAAGSLASSDFSILALQ